MALSNATPPGAGPHEAIPVVPLRRPGRIIATIVVLLLAGCLLYSVATNPRFEFDVVRQYLTAGAIMSGLLRTLELTVIAMTLATVLGVLIAIMRLSPNPIVSGASWLYVWFFRGVPLLVQLIFWGFISALYPRISLGIPGGPSLFSFDANHVLTPFLAAILGLGLHEAAYVAEIARSGILSVPRGQIDAGSALGMPRMMMMRRIILPQAMRVIIPPLGNETVSMLKYTSLVSVLAFQELLYSAQVIYSRTYQVIPLLLVATFWYLVLVSALSLGQYALERRFGRGRATVQRQRRARSRPALPGRAKGGTRQDGGPA